jgi:hypothetical protein
MPFSGMLCRVAHVRTDISEERSACIIKVTRIGEIGRTLSVTSSVHRLLVANVVPSSPFLVTLVMEAIRSTDTSVLTRATRRNILEGILQNHRHENLKSYIPDNVYQYELKYGFHLNIFSLS